MTFRLDPDRFPNRAKVQFTTSVGMPSLIYQACVATGTVSSTVYCQYAIIDALVRDLGLDRDELIAGLPVPRGPGAHLYSPQDWATRRRPITEDQTGGVWMVGPANTIEDVR